MLCIELIKSACQKLDLPLEIISADQALMVVKFADQKHFIYNFSLGLCTNAQSKLCHDKAYQYELLSGVINLPRTQVFVDPLNKRYHAFAQFTSHQQIADIISREFISPTIIKKNRGSEGVNVFLCDNQEEINRAVKKVFRMESQYYDHVLLAQDYIKPSKEFRVIIYQGKIRLVYEKRRPTKNTHISPLHNPGAQAVLVKDKTILDSLEKFIKPALEKFPLDYAGYDIIQNKKGKLWLIEINADPSYSYFVKDNGTQEVESLFLEILQDLSKRYQQNSH